ncbi:hypothetical protein RSOLAG22IIIB_00770 [Rhizoctonia solani]|uniref:T6SS Phospholipase effector Tle1-like catalytic domain-containing protein n=1 Tax=Rhizoctonia solani TaxID=456999 RepID=A0A0K6FWR9_9AGAM|nr:hypothetical protein RSOLAG22IIIB_00770 [Rhizoctonia solani]
MALDERRAWFVVDPWHIRPAPRSGPLRGLFSGRKDPNDQSLLACFVEWLTFGGCKELPEVERHGRPPGETSRKLFTASPNIRSPTDVKEVWFAGCHSDVGGGNVPDSQHSLSDITLRWMVRECTMANTKVVWNEPRLRQLQIDISPERLQVSKAIAKNAPVLRQSQTAPSYEKVYAPQLAQFDDKDEAIDAQLSQVHDSLVFKWLWPTFITSLLWWILELLPMRQWTQDADGKWLGSFRINYGRPRRAASYAGNTPLFHISVLAKEQGQIKGQSTYKPRAILEEGVTPTYVD